MPADALASMGVAIPVDSGSVARASNRAAGAPDAYVSGSFMLLLTGLLSTYWIYDRSKVAQSLREEMDVAHTRRSSPSLTAFRTLYTSEVVQRLQGKGLDITHDYVDRDDAIPQPATMTKLLGEEISSGGSDVTVRLFSEYPFRPRGRDQGGGRGRGLGTSSSPGRSGVSLGPTVSLSSLSSLARSRPRALSSNA